MPLICNLYAMFCRVPIGYPHALCSRGIHCAVAMKLITFLGNLLNLINTDKVLG